MRWAHHGAPTAVWRDSPGANILFDALSREPGRCLSEGPQVRRVQPHAANTSRPGETSSAFRRADAAWGGGGARAVRPTPARRRQRAVEAALVRDGVGVR